MDEPIESKTYIDNRLLEEIKWYPKKSVSCKNTG